jgi:hypothetical protein
MREDESSLSWIVEGAMGERSVWVMKEEGDAKRNREEGWM